MTEQTWTAERKLATLVEELLENASPCWDHVARLSPAARAVKYLRHLEDSDADAGLRNHHPKCPGGCGSGVRDV